jgi:putative membrane protein
MSGEASPAIRAAVALLITVIGVAAIIVLFGDAAYMWIKAAHVVAIISWMAGMLYLPRLFVYHCEAKPGSELSETLKVMEHRLLRVIINPAMALAWVLGLWLAWRGHFLSSGWFHAKLAFVILLSGFHGFLSASVRRFAEDANTTPMGRWRLLNEVPALLMIAIVILVIVKPF